MDRQFAALVDTVAPTCERLLGMEPLIASQVPAGTPVGGVYLFSEHGSHLYVGRTKRVIGVRIRSHFGQNLSAATFAWLLAREATGSNASYTKARSRMMLLTDPDFKAAHDRARARIRGMHVRYVHEPDPLRQALLEIYVAVAAEAKYNDFDTH